VESVPLWSGVRRALSHWFHRDHGADLISEAPGAASATLGRRTEVSPRQPSLPPQRDDDPAPAFVRSYFGTLDRVWQAHDWTNVVALTETLQRVWRENRQVFLCGNGGSAANAIHLANDFLYGVDKKTGRGLRVTALPANGAVLTCLANDVSYEDVFAQQLTVLANRGDVLIALSGSGNSPNILKALTRARELGVETFAILGFTGGRALGLADHPIYFPVHDMQVAEDLQMMVGHMAMQWLSRQPR
jgi:D-sedoheptulose 7-phosphate isomerase